MLIRFLIVMLLTIGFLFNIGANDNYIDIKEIINDFITFQKDIMLYGEDKIDLLKNNIKCSDEELEYAINDALNKYDIKKSSPRVLVGYSFHLHDFQFSEEKDILVVSFFEDYEENYEWTNSYKSTRYGDVETVKSGRKDKSAGNNIENIITLNKDKNGEWQIVDHNVYIMAVQKKKQEDLDKLKPFTEIFKSKEYNGADMLLPKSKARRFLHRPVGDKYKIKEIE